MISIATALLAFHTPAIKPFHTRRTSTPLLQITDGMSRQQMVAAMEGMKADGSSKLWNTMRLAPRAVSLRELTQSTKLEPKVLDPTATEFEIGDIQDISVKVLIACTVASGLWAVGTDALGLDAGLRFTGTYLIAGIPIAGLAIGSTAPGLLFLPIEAFRSITASDEEKKTRAERVAKHEASHLLCAHVLGLPVQEVSVDANGGPRVVVYDEESAQAPGTFVGEGQVEPLAVVALSGLMAEAEAFGKALGASEDLKLLNSLLLRSRPPLSAQAQQDTTRYAALMAWTIIQKHRAAYDAITSALMAGKGLSECIKAAEAAEATKEAAGVAAATAMAEAIKKETPQEKAARERAEDAARGRF